MKKEINGVDVEKTKELMEKSCSALKKKFDELKKKKESKEEEDDDDDEVVMGED